MGAHPAGCTPIRWSSGAYPLALMRVLRSQVPMFAVAGKRRDGGRMRSPPVGVKANSTLHEQILASGIYLPLQVDLHGILIFHSGSVPREALEKQKFYITRILQFSNKFTKLLKCLMI